MNPIKKQPLNKKSPVHSSQQRLKRETQGSLEHRDENCRDRLNKKSKDKLSKQPSALALRPPSKEEQKRQSSYASNFPSEISYVRRSAANVREVQFSLVDQPKEDYRARYYNTLKQMELQDSRCMGKCFSQQQFHTEGNANSKINTRSSEEELCRSPPAINASHPKVLKCHYHPTKDAKYLVELNPDEDILCCLDCGANLASRGCTLQEISALKSKRNYEMDEFLQKCLHSMEILKKCLTHLPDHYKQLNQEIKDELEMHDAYYNHLIGMLQQKKQETQKMLMGSMNSLTENFNKIHGQFHQQLTQLQQSYNEIIVNREEIKKMNDIDFSRIIKVYRDKLAVDSVMTLTVDLWKVEIGDPQQFQADIQKYLIKIEEKPEKQEKALSQQNDSELLCEEELDWGYKQKPQSTTHNSHNKDIYFSFEKRQSEESVSSPAFKQI